MRQLSDGNVIGDKYILDRPLARGGMGTVWIARHRDLQVPVAIKFMDPALTGSPELRSRFEREARSAALLESRHVVQIRDYGVDGDRPFIVMELLRGESLQERLTRRPRLPLPEAARIVVHIARGLQRAHNAGIVHRDLKPANVFLGECDGEEVSKILDFGIAKTEQVDAAHATRTGLFMGSVHFSSPEQLRATKRADARSDLWSLGVIAYRMVTGALPFVGEEIADVIVKICADPIPKPSEIAPDLSVEVDEYFRRALDRDPNQRFQSATELAESFVSMVDSGAGAQLVSRASFEPAPPRSHRTTPPASGGAVPSRTVALASLPARVARTGDSVGEDPLRTTGLPGGPTVPEAPWSTTQPMTTPLPPGAEATVGGSPPRSARSSSAPAPSGVKSGKWLLLVAGILIGGAAIGIPAWRLGKGQPQAVSGDSATTPARRQEVTAPSSSATEPAPASPPPPSRQPPTPLANATSLQEVSPPAVHVIGTPSTASAKVPAYPRPAIPAKPPTPPKRADGMEDP